MRDQVAPRWPAPAHRLGRLLAEQRAYLDEFWERADVEIDGDAEIQQAVRFALFHILQAARAPSSARSRPRA
jgi:alpha,alpha-trehalose phosphorylase